MRFLTSYLIVFSVLCSGAIFKVVRGQHAIPASPCPQIFQYYTQPNGEVYGRIDIPYDGSTSFNLGVNASMKGYYTDNSRVKLKIKMDTPTQELHEQRARTITYSVYFPFQNAIPKITNIELNNRGYCRGPPEELIPGSPGVTSLWAGHRYYFQTVPKNEPPYINEPPPNIPPSVVENIGQPVQPVQPLQPVIPTSTEYSSPNDDNDVVLIGGHKHRGCGISSNTIVPLILGGEDLNNGRFPWLVAMFTAKGSGYEYKCTANLISNKHVVTAARCVQYYKVQIVPTDDILFIFGRSDLKKWAVSGAVTRGAVRVQAHPDFAPESGHGDIAVITLDKPVEYSNTIAPICMWEGDSNINEIVDTTGTVAGWGADEGGQKAGHFDVPIAKFLDMPIVAEDKCLSANFTYYSLTSEMTFCAGRRDGSGICIGDSGAGFMINKHGKYYLRGLASKPLIDSNGKCDASFFVIFCDVAKVTDWIKRCMRH